MSQNTFYSAELDNGITLVGEEMPNVSSAALSILIPFGSSTDPDGFEGSSKLLSEMIPKGAGTWDARGLSEEFEVLGVHRSHAVGNEASVFSFAMLAENLPKALELSSVMLLQPAFPADELDNVRQLVLQELHSLEDHPSSKVMTLLAKAFYPHPYGRSQLGTKEGVHAVTIEGLNRYYSDYFLPQRVIISVAGKFDWAQVCESVNRLFGGWSGDRSFGECPALGTEDSYGHHEQDTSQVQIALAYPSVPYEHPDYYAARVGVGVLSGGMAGRLFVEVREKRGLVYRVSASHSAAKHRAAVFASAGTTPERAQETLDVMLGELRCLGEGVSDEELERSKADLKARLVMQGELSTSRAAALVNDWWNLKRIRPLDEIKSAVDAVGNADICRHLNEFPVSPVSLVTLGPCGVSL